MGTYFDYPSGQMVHDRPEWTIREGCVSQDENLVYLWC